MSFHTIEAENGMIKNVFVTNINGASYPPSGGGGNPESVSLGMGLFSYFGYPDGFPIGLGIGVTTKNGTTPIVDAHDYGEASFKAAAGTYSMDFPYLLGSGNGILKIDVNGVYADEVDMYSGIFVNTPAMKTFEFSLVDGLNTLRLYCDSKNASSAEYVIPFFSTVLSLNKLYA